MKNRFSLFCLLAALAVSCVKDQQEIVQMITDDPVFHAAIENSGDLETRVYADDQLRVLWNADDRVSIFNKTTYNREYAFQGNDGDNSGTFKKVPNDDFVTSNPLNYVYSVYPYNENTSISNDGEITVYLPSEQTYREDSFGLGANTMIAITEEDELMFKNLCGYFVIKLYGDNVSVSSITLKGNNDELLSGKATVIAAMGSAPELQFDQTSASKEITLTCPNPVTLGTTPETATTFWFVVPPITFENGFTLTVINNQGLFRKSASSPLQISRNTLKKTAALEVEAHPKNVICYTSSDGRIVTPYREAAFGAKVVSNEYVDGQGYITFDRNVTSFGNNAFLNCSTLTSLDVPSGVTSIGEAAFCSCSRITSLVIPDGVTSIGSSAFFGCSSLTSLDVPSGVTSIGESAFCNCSRITSLAIPSGVTSIGDYTFDGCSNLTSLDIPEGVTSIGSGAFFGCSSLTSLAIPSGVTSIGRLAFYGCSSLTTLVIPDGVTSIGDDTFHDCSRITSLVIPSGVTSIGEYAFSGCSNLTSLDIPEGVTSIGSCAFAGCSNLTSLDIPEGVTSIGSGTFVGCSSLTSLAIPSGVTSIGNSAFRNCSSLTSLVIPSGVTSIGSYTFAGCSNLTSLDIPEGVTSIEEAAFFDCSSLTSLAIPDDVKSIGNTAFTNCSSLTSLAIPSGVTSIGGYAFISCTGLRRVDCKAIVPPSGGYAMFNNTNSCPIYVPVESVDAYKAAGYWCGYANRIYAIQE